MERLIRLNVKFEEELSIDMVLNFVPSCYDQFILSYHLNKTETTLALLHNLLHTVDSGMKGKNQAPTTTTSAPILDIGKSKGKKRNASPKANWKYKA